VNYNKFDQKWAYFEYVVPDGTDLSRFNKLVFTVRGEGAMLLVMESATETYQVRVNLTAGNVMNQVNLRDYDAFLGALERVRIFLAPGLADTYGQAVFSQFQFDEGTAYGTVLEVEAPAPVNVLSTDWLQDDAAGVYTIAADGDAVTFDYVKGAGVTYAWAKLNLDADTVAGLNTMVITVTGTAGKTVLLKPNDSGGLEKVFTFEEGVPVVYTVNSAEFTSLVVFAEPGVESVSGSFTIESVELSYTPSEYSRWENISFLTADWVGNVDGLYTCDANLDGSININYDLIADTSWWTAVKYYMPEYYGNHNAVKLTIQGDAGLELYLKPNDNSAFENHVFLTGEEQSFVFPMGVAPTSFIIIVNPNLTPGLLSGTIKVINAEVTYIPEGNDVTSGWEENDPGTYTMTAEENEHIMVEYTKGAEQGWVFMRNNFNAELTDGMNTMMVILKGEPGAQVLLKPNDDGALEHWVTFVDDQPIVTYISANQFTNLIMFGAPGVAGVNGSFEIWGVYLFYVKPAALERDVVVDFTTGWVDNGDSVYTFDETGGETLVTYTKAAGQEWSTMKYTFTDNLAMHNMLTFVVQGTSGKQILIKVNNQYETWVTFDGTEQTVEIPLVVGPESVLIFAEGGTVASGTFTIISAEASFEPFPVSIESGWAENDAGTYAITDNGDGTFTVDYTKTASQTYVFMINTFDVDEVFGRNTLTITVQGEVGKTLLIKPNDSGAMEELITFDGTEQTFTYTATGFTKILLFAEGGTAGVSGSFDIISLELSYVPAS